MRSERPRQGVRDGRGAEALWIGAIFVVPALLYAPILYYSLNSPFSLIDDYSHWRYLRILESPSSFFAWLEQVVRIGGEAGSRYRPAWEIYNALVWKWLGANSSAHHLVPWMLHFGAVAFFCAAFRRICAIHGWDRPGARLGYLLPLGLMVHVGLFFPNLPSVRIGTQEPLTVFFLGLCNYVAAIALSWESQRRGSPAGLRNTETRWRWLYGLFLLGFLGVTFSKEINFALSLGLLLAYFVFVCLLKKAGWRAVLAGLPLLVAAALMITRVYAATEDAGVGYGRAWAAYTTMANAAKMLLGLFQVETSVVVAAGFVLLLGTFAIGRLAGSLQPLLRTLNASKNGGAHGGAVDYELAFVLFLVLQFICMFGILAASWGTVLRYWHPLVPVLSMLLAFAAKFVLHGAGRLGWPERRVAWPLVAFVAFFVACNYCNFAFQTIVWHSLSSAEEELIEEVRALSDRGEHVVVDARDELECSLIHRVGEFVAFFRGVDFTVHEEPPKNGPYYFVTGKELPRQEKVATIASRREYGLLAAASTVSGALQLRREPFQQLDAGVNWNRSGRPYAWNIYRIRAPSRGDQPKWPTTPPVPCRS